jgi:DHA1 family inner membrane transport protein
MAFFRNDTVNLLNLHYGIHALAMSGGGAFFAAFLLRAGVPAPAVLAAIALIVAGRFIIRPLMLVPARRFGLRPLVVVGTVLTGLQFPLLAEVHGIGSELLVWCAFSSLGDTIYWTSYHAYFASLGDSHHRGHQLGAREAIAATVGIVGPLAGGWALTTLGPRIAFDVTAVVQILAAVPLFATPNVSVARQAPGVLSAAFPGILMFAVDGFIAAGFYFVWQIALFMALGESYTAYGGAVALAALVGAASGLALGRFIDLGHGRRAAWLAAGSLAVALALRAASLGNPILAVAANECRGRARAVALRADPDDGGLQSGKGVALRAAFPHRDRRRLGCRRRDRMPHRRDPAVGRRADCAWRPVVAVRHGSDLCAAPPLLSSGRDRPIPQAARRGARPPPRGRRQPWRRRQRAS